MYGVRDSANIKHIFISCCKSSYLSELFGRQNSTDGNILVFFFVVTKKLTKLVISCVRYVMISDCMHKLCGTNVLIIFFQISYALILNFYLNFTNEMLFNNVQKRRYAREKILIVLVDLRL